MFGVGTVPPRAALPIKKACPDPAVDACAACCDGRVLAEPNRALARTCPTGNSRMRAMRKLPVVPICRRCARLPRRGRASIRSTFEVEENLSTMLAAMPRKFHHQRQRRASPSVEPCSASWVAFRILAQPRRANHNDALAHPASMKRGVRAVVTTREAGMRWTRRGRQTNVA
jgi:hypothetical protein